MEVKESCGNDHSLMIFGKIKKDYFYAKFDVKN